ncbi:uncharacterized protein EI97DRAFT_456750 [Westerdykella ornata]|uniref:Kazal-like domain-containing protein n=1 Tax=Westerdykella ornata TaxID=318751 RepID=A0A6A6JP81_WESOR|nr:uncharacterized protein EI97DRAFT_456750 [Westerdykella ornata]KAF2278332.1 hypothetical protein EI97DRAFT_456750 [Westerdykella ornata]
MLSKPSTLALAFLATLVPSAVLAAPAPAAAPTGEVVDVPRDVCLAICYFDEPECGAPSYAVKTNECWTCCTPQWGPVETRDE